MSKTGYTNADLSSLLRRHKQHLKCWHTGLRYGSLVYFELGEKLEKRLKNGSLKSVGSSTLVLEGYTWVILKDEKLLAVSDSVTREFAERELASEFAGRTLANLHFSQGQLLIRFTGQLRILSQKLATREFTDRSLCTLVLPDGTIIGCDPDNGFFSDGSTSRVHAQRHALVHS